MMLTRGKLAKQVGCNIETIRYYENVGMLPAPARAENGYRVYGEEHLKRLQFIQRIKELGFSTESTRNLLRISESIESSTRAEVKGLVDDHIDEISKKITDLQQLMNALAELSEHCDGAHESAEDCPIINSLYDNPSNQA